MAVTPNQLITQCRDRDALLQGACDCLTETRGYGNGWILGRFQRTVLHVGARLAKGSHCLRFLLMRLFAGIWQTVAGRIGRCKRSLAKRIPRGCPLIMLAVLGVACLACPLRRAGAEDVQSPVGTRIKGIRQGQILINVERPDVLKLQLQIGYGWMRDASVFGPDGRRIALVQLKKDRSSEVLLDKGRGTYRVVVGGVSVWQARTHHSSILFRPEREITSLQQSYEDFSPYYFHVPPGTERAVLSFTNQRGMSGEEAYVRLTAPDGTEVLLKKLDAITAKSFFKRIGAANEREAELKYEILTERHTLEKPEPGMWKVEAACRTHDDVGFWLEGLPNLFSISPDTYFKPRFPLTTATVTVNACELLGKTGLPAVICGFSKDADKQLEIVKHLGMKSVTDYVSHGYREPRNDNDDPFHTNWDGFNFGPQDSRVDYIDRGGFLGLTHLQMSGSKWCGKLASDKWMANLDEVAEFVEAYMLHYTVRRPSRMKHFTFINEPNLSFGKLPDGRERYMKAFKAVGKRVSANEEIRAAGGKLGAPNVVFNPYENPFDWIEQIIRDYDEYLDVLTYDVYAYDMDDVWRYAADIEKMSRMIDMFDRDGQREDIAIFETNLKGGLYIQPSKQDTHYSAVWWPAVLCNTLGTGRISAVTYFFLYENTARRKALLKKDFSRKPVYWSMKLANDTLLPMVARSTCNHTALDVMATTDPKSGHLSVMLVNRAERDIALKNMNIRLPNSLELNTEDDEPHCSHRITTFTAADKKPVKGEKSPLPCPNRTAKLNLLLPKRSVVVLEIEGG